jgi:gas vesicle protein
VAIGLRYSIVPGQPREIPEAGNGQEQTESNQHLALLGWHSDANGCMGSSREPVATAEMKSRPDLSLRKGLIMAQNIISKGNYFLMGLAIGSLIGVLFAPESGEETREYIALKTKEGNELARKKARELRDRVEETIERGKEVIAQTDGQIATAIEVGRETYHREKAKAHVS